MAAVAELTLSVIPSPLTRPVLSGQVAPPGVTLRTQEARSVDDNSRRMLDLAFDVGEMSLATFTKARSRACRSSRCRSSPGGASSNPR